MRIVILGGSGFVGTALLRRLARDGHELLVLTRNRSRHRELALGARVQVAEGDVYDRDWLARQFAGADAVINLVGILNESGVGGAGGREFERAHVQLTAAVIAACVLATVPRLLQMSALNAGADCSHYLRTRGAAEALLRSSALRWTLFRPSVIFGPGDGLFCRFAQLLSLTPVLPLAAARARFQPVAVADVAEAFAIALSRTECVGETCELGGPEVVTLAEIVRRTATWSGLRRLVLPLPAPLGWLQAALLGLWPFANKPLSLDNFRSLARDSVLSGEDGLQRLGIAKTPMSRVMPEVLRPRA
ncbi:MAG: complex I NDUFA9 subunit family protein [Xanthomonadales bacterium]|nr:complex I NDUFA9 subunit family protein [Xanthomonadales bacterium]